MDITEFLGLVPAAPGDHDAARRMPVTPGVCTPLGFLFGGAALAAAVQVLEDATGRPLIWATAQYVSHVHPPTVLTFEIEPLAAGVQVTQARVTASAGGVPVVAVSAALGERPVEAGGSWLAPPDAPSPADCQARMEWRIPGEGISGRLDSRIAKGRTLDELDGTPGDGHSMLWVRLPELDGLSAAALGILADHVPFAIRHALGRRAGGTSLDTTLRIVRLVPTTWVLLDIRIHAIARGFAHGRLDMWSEGGQLLATAAQSASVRFWRE